MVDCVTCRLPLWNIASTFFPSFSRRVRVIFVFVVVVVVVVVEPGCCWVYPLRWLGCICMAIKNKREKSDKRNSFSVPTPPRTHNTRWLLLLLLISRDLQLGPIPLCNMDTHTHTHTHTVTKCIHVNNYVIVPHVQGCEQTWRLAHVWAAPCLYVGDRKLAFIIDCNTAMHGALHTNQLPSSSAYYIYMCVCVCVCTCARKVMRLWVDL